MQCSTALSPLPGMDSHPAMSHRSSYSRANDGHKTSLQKKIDIRDIPVLNPQRLQSA